jgi:hypothetical protein
MRYRLGVSCHIGTSELAALRRKLVDGLKLATFSACLFAHDLIGLEVLDALLDL